MPGLLYKHNDPDNPTPVERVIDTGDNSLTVVTSSGTTFFVPKSDVKKVARISVETPGKS